MTKSVFTVLTILFATVVATTLTFAEEWSVPLAGNTFRSEPVTGERLFDSDGVLHLRDANDVYSVFFHVSRPSKLSLAVLGRAVRGNVAVFAHVNDNDFSTQISDQPSHVSPIGDVLVSHSGYVKIDLRCGADNDLGAELSELLVTSDVDGAVVDCVKSNDGNMFYWGRRGPSVHLGYQLPQDKNLVYGYSEIEVPAGQDAIGSYFMANGFGEGYFGIQVNSDTERRVLFSVWSPFHTDNPADIPEGDRIVTLAKGEAVTAQAFGNEGSGGQSFLVYPWKAGKTYRFLTEVTPDGEGNTQYTSWFGDKLSNEWRLIASFRRPKTNKYLTGFHSFLENFSPEYGNLQRSAQYGNQWVRDTVGEWHEITRARFTGDDTARGRHRVDFAGGFEDDSFILRHCGFFDDQISLDQVFQRDSAPTSLPEVKFDELPRG